MQQRKRARERVVEAELAELLHRLDLALMRIPARPSVCRALSDLNCRLSAASPKPAWVGRPTSPRRRRTPVVESLPLFS
jgi:hypothetical protein